MVTIRISRRVAFLVVLGVLLVIPAVSWASHTFTDVPDSNIFHDDIAWLADAEVTKGCNPPDNTEFCPDNAVTRAQMAAFMRRFARYLDAEDGTPGFADSAGDADTLDGLDSTALLGGGALAFFAGGDQAESLPEANVAEIVRTVTFTAPTDGTVIANSTLNASDPDFADSVVCSITEGSIALDTTHQQKWASGGLDRTEDGQVAGTRGFEVTGGEEVTINLVCQSARWLVPGSPMEVRDSALTVMFFPG
jgi:hypothetical protein